MVLCQSLSILLRNPKQLGDSGPNLELKASAQDCTLRGPTSARTPKQICSPFIKASKPQALLLLPCEGLRAAETFSPLT